MAKAAKTKPLPPLPSEVFTINGPVPVLVVEDLRAPGDPTEPLFGFWDPFARTISIRKGLHPTAAWLTLYHEAAHAHLSEIGVKLTEDQEEAVVNAIAAVRYAELVARLP